MNKQEISIILTQSGEDGLEKEIKSKLRKNDIWWAGLSLFICLIWIGDSIRQNRISQAEIQQFKYDYATKVGKQYGMAMDSLVKISENNGIENCVIKK